MSLLETYHIAEDILKQGYVFIEGHSPTTSTDEAFSLLGDVERLDGLGPIQELTPKESDSTPPNSYSGNFGLHTFPLHTDMAHWFNPPRYLALRCITGSQTVKTLLIDGMSMLDVVGTGNLTRTLVQPRRPINGQKPILHVAEKVDEGQIRIRWDSIFINPCSSFSREICAQVAEYLESIQPLEFALRNPGDTLIVDNWRMLHGRSPVSKADTGRVIHRAYLSSLR